jgi:hypothetical protein
MTTQCSGESGMRLHACAVDVLLNAKHRSVLLASLFVCTYFCVVIFVILLSVVLQWVIVIISKGARRGPTFSNPVVLLTLYRLASFRPQLFTSVGYINFVGHMDGTETADIVTLHGCEMSNRPKS